jgi:hydroxyacylglutathione hydrolase
MPLEDDFCDIIKKARIGQGLSVGDVARMAGLPGGDITALERGTRPPDRPEVQALAKTLGLRPDPLEQIAIEKWEPVAQLPTAWVERIQGSINGYGVQGYVVYDGGEALLIDTAYNAPAMIEFLSEHQLRLMGICLTHGHADHADGIDQILNCCQAPVYLGTEDVGLLSWRPPGREFVRTVSDDAGSHPRRDLLSNGRRVRALLFRRRYVVCGIHWPLESQYPVSDPPAVGPDSRTWVAA